MGYIGNQQAEGFVQRPTKQDLTGATGTSLTLTHAVSKEEDIDLYINNVKQEPTTAYTVADTAVTLTGSVVASDDIYVVYNSLALQTVVPPDGSVTTAKLASGAVTNAKIDTMAATKLTGHRTSSNIILFSGVGYNSTQAISTTTTTGLFDDVTLSGSSYFSNVVANYNNMVDEDSETARFTPPEDGYYFINYQVAFNGGNNNIYNGIHLFKNTTQHTKAFNNTSHSSSAYSSAVITAVLDLTTSDYVDFKREIQQSTNLTSNGTSIVIYKMF